MKKSSFSWDSRHFQNGESFSPSRGMPRDGEMFSWMGWGMVRTFQNGESFSPFLLISWDSVRFVQTLPPPRELLSISWDLQTKIINRSDFYTVFCRNQVSPGILVIFKMVRVSPHFSSSRGIQLDLSRPYPLHEKFSPSRGIYRLK